MSIPKRMQEFAALYGCEIDERYSGNSDEGDVLYARIQSYSMYGDVPIREEFVCRSYYGNHVDLNKLKEILQRVSGRTLAQFWTGR